MRKPLYAILMTIALIAVFSCGKEPVSDITPEPVPMPVIQENKTANNDPIDGYYDKWVDIVRRMLLCCRENELEQLLNSNLPEIGSLAKLHIYDAAGNAIRFADLPKDEQLDFIEAIAGAIAAEQHRKAEIAREITDQYYILDGLMSICQNSIRRMTDEGTPISRLTGYFTPERGWSEITKDLNSFRKFASGIEFPIVIGPLRPEFLSFESVRNQMAGVGKKGMIAVQLPIHGRPNTVWNLSNYLLSKEESAHIHRALGHTNILTGDFLTTTQINDSLFYGVDTDGAGYEDLKDWCTTFYLMEIKSLKFIWDPENYGQPLNTACRSTDSHVWDWYGTVPDGFWMLTSQFRCCRPSCLSTQYAPLHRYCDDSPIGRQPDRACRQAEPRLRPQQWGTEYLYLS